MLLNQFPTLLMPQEASAEQEVLVEMHAGVGGQEAMLFTNEVFAMYQKHFRYKGWNAQVLDCEYSDIGWFDITTIFIMFYSKTDDGCQINILFSIFIFFSGFYFKKLLVNFYYINSQKQSKIYV